MLDDYQDDDDETFSLVLSDVSGAIFSPVGDTLTAIGTITDDDVLPTLSVGSGTGSEATGEVVFTVSLSSISNNNVTFKYRTEIGTDDTAQPADFTAIGAVGAETDGIIRAGSSTVSIVVAITDDIEDDEDETFSLVLSDVSGAVFSPAGDTITATGTITDDDYTLSVGAVRGDETSREVVFTVSLSSTAISAVTFKYRTEIGKDDTADQADFTAIGAVGTGMEVTIATGSSTLRRCCGQLLMILLQRGR